MRVLLVSLCFLLAASGAQARDFNFQNWLSGVRQEALQRGIAPTTVDAALSFTELDPDVLELDQKQPEKTVTFADYSARVVSDRLISQGLDLYHKHARLLHRIQQRYGVAPKYIIALWGVETRYGANTGGFNVVNALATLAYDGRRANFFRTELMNALTIIDRGEIAADEMEGSWAGAMGQCQFMPSTYLNYAVDFDGNGHRDIWYSLPDIFASIANYLRAEGWQPGTTWGRPVMLTRSIPENLVGLKHVQSLKSWQDMGVRQENGAVLPSEAMMASLVQPDGPEGSSYLVYNNYQALMRWNRSTYFATTVGLLADAIAF